MQLQILFFYKAGLSYYISTYFFSPDIHSLEEACKQNPWNNNPSISLSAMSLPTHVLMNGLPPATPAFAIRLYAEKMGADVTNVNILPSHEAVVTLTNHSGKC